MLFTYDSCGANSMGRLCSTAANDSTGATISSTALTVYDTLGRIRESRQTTAGQTYIVGYNYNLADSLTSQTYPSGRVITTEYDEAGRIAGVRKSSGQFYAGLSEAMRIEFNTRRTAAASLCCWATGCGNKPGSTAACSRSLWDWER